MIFQIDELCGLSKNLWKILKKHSDIKLVKRGRKRNYLVSEYYYFISNKNKEMKRSYE